MEQVLLMHANILFLKQNRRRVRGASVWNDMEGQTGDCGCRVSITSEGTKAPVCHLRHDTPRSLHFILLTGKMC